jgi:glycine cleavage system aminomethyltransferase T
MKVIITNSEKPLKKLKAIFTRDNGKTKTIHFGAVKPNGHPYDDYTITKDKEQRARYIARHADKEDFNNPMTAGSLSRYVLWGDSTSKATNIREFKKRFNLN